MSPLNSILINQYGWLFLFKLTLQRRPITTAHASFRPATANPFANRPKKLLQGEKEKAKTQCAGILLLSKCHVLNKLRVAIQPIDRFRCGFLHNYNSWHCYAACPPKTWNILHISHSHYQLLSSSSDRHVILLPASTPPCAMAAWRCQRLSADTDYFILDKARCKWSWSHYLQCSYCQVSGEGPWKLFSISARIMYGIIMMLKKVTSRENILTW